MTTLQEKRQKAVSDHIQPLVKLAGDGPELAQKVIGALLAENGLTPSDGNVEKYVGALRDRATGKTNTESHYDPVIDLALGHAISRLEGAVTPVPIEPVKHSSPEQARIAQMVQVTRSQDGWDTDKLNALHLAAAETNMSATEFAEKLKSVRVAVNPVALADPQGNGGGGYSIPAVLEAWYTGDPSLAPSELAQSRAILQDLSIPVSGRPGALALPFSELFKLSSTLSGVGSTVNVSGAAGREVAMYRADRSDPAIRLIELMDRRDVRDGQLQASGVTVPTPVATAEPDNTGYASTGDLSVASTTVQPLIIQTNFRVSRAADLTIQQLLTQAVTIGNDKMLEELLAAVLWGSGTTPAATGVYNAGSVGSSANLGSGVSDITATILTSALEASYEGGNRRIVCSPAARNAMRTLALPAAVSPLMVNEIIDQVPVVQTMTGVAMKPARAIIGDFSEVLLGIWGGSVFLTRGFYRGLEEVYLELFYNVQLKRAARLYRLRQD